jgi:hypothetical protein
LLHLASRVAFDLDVGFDRFADRLHVGFAELVDLLLLRNARDLAEPFRPNGADALDVRERIGNCLATGKIHTSNARHALTLPLLVPRIGTDDAKHAAAADDLAFVANLFDARSDLHGFVLSLVFGAPTPKTFRLELLNNLCSVRIP